MKKLFSLSIILVLSLCACSTGAKTDTTTAVKEAKVEETNIVETLKAETSNEIISSVHRMSEREFSFDPTVKFTYTGTDKYLKAITEDIAKVSEEGFGGQGAVLIPTPFIVKTDDSDKSNIKVYGDFWTFGYEMNGTIFQMKNGGSYPGCYYLKEDNGNVEVIKREIAEDGSNNWPSLVKICGGDEALAREVSNASQKDNEKVRTEYIKMYANANNLRVSGIKDYGWPIILFDDIDDATFMYNFYNSYFAEVREEDYLNDLPERLTRLKEKYFTKELLNKIDSLTESAGADMVINAQDVTEEMLDTLQADNYGNGNVKVSYGSGDTKSVANIKVETKNGKKVITDITFE